MKSFFLAIMAALGGNVDLSELVFTVQSGARFGYLLLWVIVLGTVGMMVFAEMSGRIAAVLRKPTFELVRDGSRRRVGLAVLLASNLVNLLTCTAEVGGMALVLQLLFGGDHRLMLVGGTGMLLAALYFLRFDVLDRIFGLLGLGLLVYAATAVSLQPDWSALARGFVPAVPDERLLSYAYFAVGLFSSILMPYEIYFYSSGALEDGWTVEELPSNFFNAAIGFAIGGLVTAALLVVGAQVFAGQGIDPHLLGTSALPPALVFGVKGLLLALLGMLFAIGGAAAETALAGAYSVAQYVGKPWGLNRKPREARLFYLSLVALLAASLAVALSGVNPLDVVEYSVLFAVVVLPFTYYPVLKVAGDRRLMGRYATRPWLHALGWVYLVLITLGALAAVPLMFLTHMGQD